MMTGEGIRPTPRHVNHIVGTTPSLAVRANQPIAGVTSVRGAVGGLNQQFTKLVLTSDKGDFRIRVGAHTARNFTLADLTLDTLTLAGHRFVTGQGPMRVTGDDLPEGLLTGAKATGILTLTGNAANTNTVVIDGKTYTFQTVLTDVDGNVLIGASASDSLDNLIAAITLGSGSGTVYAASTTLHATVTAAAGAGDTMDVTAKSAGSAGNAIATTETLTAGSFGAATLENGTDADPFIIRIDDNTFKLAASKALALAGTALDITDAGSGMFTISGVHNVVAVDPAADVSDGSGAIKVALGKTIELPPIEVFTAVGFGTGAVLTFYWE